MAPRRLIIAMLLLLAVSTALAILTPNPQREGSGGEGESARSQAEPERATPVRGDEARSRTAPEPNSNPGRTIERRIDAGGATDRIYARPGDRLVIELSTEEAGSFEVAGSGLIAWADRWAPARFDILLADGDERLEVRRVGSAEPVAVVRVR